MDKDTSEIAKLTERISKDPKSKLFVPLAEEYKKAGDPEMAIRVLTEGLKNNPGYATARSLLGRLLFKKGDLAAAQKEFEEVIKATPENLLAQKKLGDLNALLDKRSEALRYYETARSLNPGDAELSSLIEDLKAGLDIKSRLMPGKTAAAPEPAGTPAPASPPGSGAKEVLEGSASERALESIFDEAAGTTDWTTEKEPGEEDAGQAVPSASAGETDFAETGHDFTSAFTQEVHEEAEEAEEVLLVESLEEEHPSEKESFSAVDFFGDKEDDKGPAAFPTEDQGEAAPAAAEPSSWELPPTGEKEPFSSFDSGADDVAPWEGTAALSPGEQAPEEPAGEASDDFTTNTLAELYIGQGFYEKAIDIYERMLADHPDSAALKDKLENVRSMAASAEASTAEGELGEKAGTEDEAGIAAEAREYTPPAEAGTRDEEIDLESALRVEPDQDQPVISEQGGGEDLFAEPREYVPPSAEPEPAGEEGLFGVAGEPPVTERGGARNVSPDFVPREYIPPTAELGMEQGENEPVGSGRARPGRQETISRLENWLKKIKKET